MPNEGPASQRNAGMERTPARPRVARNPRRSPDRRPGVDVRLDSNLRVNSYSFQDQLYSFEEPVAGITRNDPRCCGGTQEAGKQGPARRRTTESGGRGSATRRARLHNGERGSTLEGEAPLRRRARLRSATENGETGLHDAESEAPRHEEGHHRIWRARLHS